MSLNFFPICREDEDVRSIIYKYAKESTNNHSEVNNKLFGVKSSKTPIMNRNMGQMLENILGPTTISFNYFLNEYTFWPIFRVFLQKEKIEKAYSYLYKTNSSNNIPGGFSSSLLAIISEEIRYCSVCVNEDNNYIGEVYIHRMHQFHYLDVCHIHKIKLETSCQECGKSFAFLGKYQLTKPECFNCQSNIDHQKINEVNPLLFDILNDLYILLNNKNELNVDIFLQKILIRLGNKGYIHFKGVIYKTKMINDFLKIYSNDELELFGLNEISLTNHKFITKMFDLKHVHEFVIFYLLLVRWLFGSVNKLIKSNETYAYTLPFGHGPWLCLNKICPKYNERSIMKVTRHVHEYVTGVFCCPECGLIYSRSSKQGQVEIEQNVSIDFFGDLWMNRLNELSQSGKTHVEIANIMQTSDVSVKKHLNIMNNKRKNNNQKFSKYTVKDFENRLSERRILIQQIIETNDNTATRPVIRKIVGTNLYDWLMKNDRDWMEKALPSRLPNPNLDLDYKTIDQDLCFNIIKTYDNLILIGTPRRITKNLIMHQLTKLDCGRLSAPDSKDKFLNAQVLLDSLIESVDDFQKRMFPIALDRYKKSRYPHLTRNLLKSFHSTYVKCSEEIDLWLNEKLTNCNKSSHPPIH